MSRVDCPRCSGSGVIGWNVHPLRDPARDESMDCPACHGHGDLTPGQLADLMLGDGDHWFRLRELLP